MFAKRPLSLSLLSAAMLFVGCTSGSDPGAGSGAEPPVLPTSRAVEIGQPQPAQLLQQAMLAFRTDGDAISGESRVHSAVIRNGAIKFTAYTFDNGERTPHVALSLQTSTIATGSTQIGGAPATTIDNGSALLQRGPIVERLHNEVDGLHQEWAFASSPGDGDLVIEVAVAGFPYLTSTNSGLHFAADDVLVRYSNAVWSDAGGQQWPITATFDEAAGLIRMTIPTSVVEATRFPAVLDPTISAEVAVDSPVIAPSGQTQQQGAIAFGGSTYLAVWSDARDSSSADIWGTRISTDGTVTDTLGIKIAATAGTQSRPAVAFDGTSFVVAYEDFLTTGGTVSNVKVARVGTDGTVTAVGAVASSATSEATPDVASAGGGDALVVWNTGGEIDSALVTTTVGSTVAVATGAAAGRPAVASDPTGNYLVAYTATNHLLGQLVTATGTLSGTAITISAPASGAQQQPDATWDGTNYDVVWENGADAKVYGTAISTAGAVLNTRTVGAATVGGVAINASPAQSAVPTISCTTSLCLVAWQDQRTFSTTSYDVYGQLITLAFAKSGSELPLSNGTGPQTTPRIASSGSGFYMEWTDNRVLSTTSSFGATVSTAGAVGTQTDIGTGNNRESGMAVGASGSDSGVFWRDSRGGPSIFYVGYDPTGTALASNGQAVESAALSQSSAAASADLGGNTLVVWQDTRNGSNNDIYGARVTLSSETTLDTSGIAISTAANDQLVPSVASNGSLALVAWQDLRNGSNFDVYGALLDSTGAIVKNDITISVGAGEQDDPVVTWDPTSAQFIVVWQDNSSGTFQIKGTRVDTTGAVLDAAGVTIQASANAQDSAAIGSSPTNTLAIWRESNHVRGARLTGGSALTVLDASGLALSTTASDQTNPKVGLLGATYIVVWSDDRAGNQDIYGQLVGTNGTLSGTDFGISTSTDDEVIPAVLATGTGGVRVAYEARRLDTSRAESRVITNSVVSIAVTPANPTVAKGATQQFTATATFSDGSTGNVTSSVTWTSGTTTVATITAGGLATAVAATGTSTITATQGLISGSTVLTAAPAALKSVAVSPATATIAKTFSATFLAIGTFTDGSTATLANTSVVWSSSNTAVATISNVCCTRGEAQGIAPGTVTITAVSGGFTGTASLTVTNATLTSIAVTPTPVQLLVGQTKQLTATGTFSDGSTLDLTTQSTWTSSNTSLVTFAALADVKAVALGTATITATSHGISGTGTVNVVPPSLVSITIAPLNAFIGATQTQTYTATGKFSDGSTQNLTSTVTWTSSATTVATMSANVATGVSPGGTTTITATSGAISGSTTLTVSKSILQSITVTPATQNLPNGYNVQYIATGHFMDGSSSEINSFVTFASSNTAVATISNIGGSRGIATAVAGSGTTTISASLAGLTGTATLTATSSPLTSLAVIPATVTITHGSVKQMHCNATFMDGTVLDVSFQVAWSSSNTAVATINTGNAVLTAVAAGSATLSATRAGVTGTSAITVN